MAFSPFVFAACSDGDDGWVRTENSDAIYILFVGNSFVFTGGLPEQLQVLTETHGIEVIYRDISQGGATLDGARSNAVREMQRNQFDYVVLQDQSRRPLNDLEGFLADVRIS